MARLDAPSVGFAATSPVARERRNGAAPFSSPAKRGRWRDANTHRDGGGVRHPYPAGDLTLGRSATRARHAASAVHSSGIAIWAKPAKARPPHTVMSAIENASPAT